MGGGRRGGRVWQNGDREMKWESACCILALIQCCNRPKIRPHNWNEAAKKCCGDRKNLRQNLRRASKRGRHFKKFFFLFSLSLNRLSLKLSYKAKKMFAQRPYFFTDWPENSAKSWQHGPNPQPLAVTPTLRPQPYGPHTPRCIANHHKITLVHILVHCTIMDRLEICFHRCLCMADFSVANLYS